MTAHPSLFDPALRRRGLRYLRHADPVLGREIAVQGDIWPTRRGSYFGLLCHIIIDQQISVRAGRTIWRRWCTSLGALPTPARALAQSESDMRACGISGAKGRAMRAVAEAEQCGNLRLRGLIHHGNDAVRDRLTAIKGVGPWTTEMFLIFGLGRADIFSMGDLGLRRAMDSLLEGHRQPTEEEWFERSSRWRPFRSLASLYLWRLIDST